MPSLILLKQGDFRRRALACQLPLRHPRTPWQEESRGSAKVERHVCPLSDYSFVCCLFVCFLFVCPTLYLIVLPRKLVRVNKIIVHQNFSTHSHDIALLKLGKFLQIFLVWIKVDCRGTRGPFQVSSSVSSTNWRGVSTQHYGLCVWWVCLASHDYLILLIKHI